MTDTDFTMYMTFLLYTALGLLDSLFPSGVEWLALLLGYPNAWANFCPVGGVNYMG